MSYAENPYRAPTFEFAAQADTSTRADFITKTYTHLAAAIFAFVGLEFLIFQSGVAESIAATLLGSQYSWLIVLGGFMVVSWVAESWARSATSIGMQYAGLALYVVAEAIIFVPLLYITLTIDPSIIPTAAITTLGLFGVMTAVVFATRADLSFMRRYLMFGGIAALGLIVASIVFSFTLGAIFTYAMIALACGYILFHTSAVLHQYRIGQHVAAALALFAAVALLFWYILQLFMSRD